MNSYHRIASLKTAEAFQRYVSGLGIELPFDDVLSPPGQSALSQPLMVADQSVGNRFAILPMEGWDGTTDGRPTELTLRRWQNFGRSGAKLIWGGEAVAVRPDGRANPNQLLMNETTLPALAELRSALEVAHREQMGTIDDLLIGLQLTHSGRFSRPNDKARLEPSIAYRHPILDRKFHVPDDLQPLSDDDLRRLRDDFIAAAVRARRAGFGFVDLKHCHSYLGHELLSAVTRPGPYGGAFENRTRFLREVIDGIRTEAQGLMIGVRMNAADWFPYRAGAEGLGEPEPWSAEVYPHAFGGDGTGRGVNLAEPHALVDLLDSLEVRLVCITLGSPYYNPHFLRPALFPPSDGYLPPEDPLIGVARHIAITSELKARHPRTVFVGSGYSYLQEWLPNVAQAAVRQGLTDCVGLGRMVLSYPEMPADVLAGRLLQRKRLCRTFSECTTGPRNGMVSGCYPLDPFYKERPEAARIDALKHPR